MTTRHPLLQNIPVDLKRFSISDREEIFDFLNITPSTRARICEAVFHDNITDLDTIPDISPEEKKRLNDIFFITSSVRKELFRSSDGSLKLTLGLHDGGVTETVIIPEYENGKIRKCSASISSQIGCFFGCSFCATGQMGFHRNLKAGELIDQVREAESVVRDEFHTELTHLYFMGMGEPMHNYRSLSDALTIMRNPAAPGPPPSRITVSTVGLFRQIRMLALDHPDVRLAVSIHSADQETRRRIMPASARLGLPDIREALLYYHRKTGNSITIQYLLLRDVNDRPEDARKLALYLDSLPAEVTLIMYNRIPESINNRPELSTIQTFCKILNESGFSTDIRWCYGEDIDAGCGQLTRTADRERISMSMRHNNDHVSVSG